MAGLGQRLEIRQGQGLVITPQLQQAIKLLQLSNLELEAFVEAELERNPLLQRDAEPEAELEAPKVDRAETASDEMPDAAATAESSFSAVTSSVGAPATGRWRTSWSTTSSP